MRADSLSNSKSASDDLVDPSQGSAKSMQTDGAHIRDSYQARGMADRLVSALKVLATAFFKLIRWVATWSYRGVSWALRKIYDWFKRLDGTGKILFVLNILFVIVIIVLWLDLDLWSIFYGNQ